jgi:hypothetical protein
VCSVVVFLGLGLACPSRGFGQGAEFTYEASAAYNLAGTTSVGGVDKPLFAVDSLTTVNPLTQPASLSGSLSDARGDAGSSVSLSANAAAFASAGLMRVRVNGATSVTEAPQTPASQAVLKNSFAKVTWRDGYIINGNPFDLHPGRELFVDAFLKVDGGFTTDVPAVGFGIGFGSQVQLGLVVTGRDQLGRNLLTVAPAYNGSFGVDYNNSDPNYEPFPRPPPGIIPIRMIVLESVVAELRFEMRVEAAASSGSVTTFGDAISTSTTFDADFGHTVTWGGITGITDAATGAAVTGWGIRSASGVNYAAAVPEPAGLALLFLAATGALRRRR